MLRFRLASAVMGIGLVIGILLLGRLPFFVLLTLIAVIGSYEYYLLLKNSGLRPSLILSLFGTVAFCSGAYFFAEKGVENTLVILVVVYFLWNLGLLGTRHEINCAFTFLGNLYTGFLFSYLILLRNFPDGLVWVMVIFILTWTSDTSAYTVGSLFGQHKILPRISPNKTWEGAIAALIATPGAIFIINMFGFFSVVGERLSFIQMFILGIGVAVAAQAGDIAESKLKRVTDVKDSGWIIPGHGGILDRFDSILFSGFIGYYILRIMLH